MKSAALIEIGGSHSECLYSQILFLREGGYSVTLYCSADLQEIIEGFRLPEKVCYFDFSKKNFFQPSLPFRQLQKKLATDSPDVIILNTAQGWRVRKFLKQKLPKVIPIVGTLHQVNKLSHSRSQKRISKMLRHYWVLNDYLLREIPVDFQQKVSAFYPIFYPQFAKTEIEKPQGEIWIAVPGTVELKRRDYRFFLEQAETLKKHPEIKFLLLGNGWHKHGDGEELLQEFEQAGIAGQFLMFRKFVPDPLLHGYINFADCVMPLLHPSQENFASYKNDQISGSFNLAFGHRKPLLMHETFRGISDFDENAIFYDKADFASCLMKLKSGEISQLKSLYQNTKWQFQEQCDRYLSGMKT